MNYELITTPCGTYLNLLPGDGLLDSEASALDVVAACDEVGTERLLLHAENLPEAFYNLRTRLAGDILLKFSNYHIRVAAVLKPELVGQGRFQEMVLETNRGRNFRVFYEREAAEKWLCEG